MAAVADGATGKRGGRQLPASVAGLSFATVAGQSTSRPPRITSYTSPPRKFIPAPSASLSSSLLSRKHAVMIDSRPNVSVEQYLVALRQFLPPEQIHSISKINGDIHVYFNSENWAATAVLHGLDILDTHLDIRPLVAPPVKLIISNIPPEVPSSFLQSRLGKYGHVLGPLKTLRASTSDPAFAHVLSFRRQVYMLFDSDADIAAVPRRVYATYDGVPYTFYVQIFVQCVQCGQDGHTQASCLKGAVPVHPTPEINPSGDSELLVTPTSVDSTSPDASLPTDTVASTHSVAPIPSADIHAVRPPQTTTLPTVSPTIPVSNPDTAPLTGTSSSGISLSANMCVPHVLPVVATVNSTQVVAVADDDFVLETSALSDVSTPQDIPTPMTVDLMPPSLAT